MEQNISELNSFWKKTIKSLLPQIKSIQIVTALIYNCKIQKISNKKLYLKVENEALIKVIEKYTTQIISNFDNLSTIEKISEIVINEKDKDKNDIDDKKNENRSSLFEWFYFNNEIAIRLIEKFINFQNYKKNILVILGEKDSGKSFLLEQILQYIRFLQKKGNIFNLATFSYFLQINDSSNDNFLLFDNIDDLSARKIEELKNTTKKKKNFFIFTTKKINLCREILGNGYSKESLIILDSMNNLTVDKIIKSKIKFTIYPSSYRVLSKYLTKNPKHIDNLLATLNLFYQQNNEKIVYKKDIDSILRMLNIDTSSIDKENIIATVSKKLNVEVEDIFSNVKKRKFIIARSLISAIMRYKYNFSLKEISKQLNKRSHSTILNLLDFYNSRLVDNPEITNIYNIFI